jgi:hypothetical protein
MPTTEISIAFLRRVYVKGSFSVAEALVAFDDRWGDLPGSGGDLDYHLQFSLAHYLGELPSYSHLSPTVLVADPCTDKQREVLKAWEGACPIGGLPDDFDWASLKEVPYRFAPGWRRRYKTIKPCPSC